MLIIYLLVRLLLPVICVESEKSTFLCEDECATKATRYPAIHLLREPACKGNTTGKEVVQDRSLKNIWRDMDKYRPKSKDNIYTWKVTAGLFLGSITITMYDYDSNNPNKYYVVEGCCNIPLERGFCQAVHCHTTVLPGFQNKTSNRIYVYRFKVFQQKQCKDYTPKTEWIYQVGAKVFIFDLKNGIQEYKGRIFTPLSVKQFNKLHLDIFSESCYFQLQEEKLASIEITEDVYEELLFNRTVVKLRNITIFNRTVKLPQINSIANYSCGRNVNVTSLKDFEFSDIDQGFNVCLIYRWEGSFSTFALCMPPKPNPITKKLENSFKIDSLLIAASVILPVLLVMVVSCRVLYKFQEKLKEDRNQINAVCINNTEDLNILNGLVDSRPDKEEPESILHWRKKHEEIIIANKNNRNERIKSLKEQNSDIAEDAQEKKHLPETVDLLYLKKSQLDLDCEIEQLEHQNPTLIDNNPDVSVGAYQSQNNFF